MELFVGFTRRAAASIAVALLAGLFGTVAASASGPAAAGDTFIASFLDLPAGATAGGSSGEYNDNHEKAPASQNGRYVAFISDANLLSTDAHPDVTNVYRKDRTTGTVALVSRATGNVAGPALDSHDPRISADGNLVAFRTRASLAPADADTNLDVYTRDLTTGVTTLATPGTASDIDEYDFSSNGLFISFISQDVMPGTTDTNTAPDVFRRNLISGTVNLASRIPASETAGDGANYDTSISGDGRWIAFTSQATNLVGGFVDANGSNTDVFARDMTIGTSYLISSRWNSASTGGNDNSTLPVIAGSPAALASLKVAYMSYATDVALPGVDMSGNSSVYLRSMGTVASTLISQSTGGVNANSRAGNPAISDDGNLVEFSTDATNLGPPPDYYGVYLRNVATTTTTLTSATTEYAVQGEVSGDGSLLTWGEDGGATPDSDPDTIGIFARSTPSGPIQLVSRPPGTGAFITPGPELFDQGESARRISADGRYIVFTSNNHRLPGANGRVQAYRRDLSTGEIELASRRSGANGAVSETGVNNATISADGSRVSIDSFSSLDPIDPDTVNNVYVRDFNSDTTVLVSRADGAAGAVSDANAGGSQISGDGKRVVFYTAATNLGAATGNTQVYVRDLSTSKTIVVSRDDGVAGAPGNDNSVAPRIDGDGSRVVFESDATNLLPGDDGDGFADIFVRDLSTNQTILGSRLPGPAGLQIPGSTYSSAISADGNVIAFTTATEAAAPEAGTWPIGFRQVVSRNLSTGANTLISRVPGGPPANDGARAPVIDADGSVIAFESESTNLLPGLGGDNRRAVFARQSSTGALSGPPAFGIDNANLSRGAQTPTLSDNGACLGFVARGYNAISGDASDVRSYYIHVLEGTCTDPRAAVPVSPKPKLTKVSLSPKKFAVSKKKTAAISAKKKAKKGTKIKFTLNVNASVTIKIEKKGIGRKVKGKCRKATKKNKAKKKCSRFVKAGKLVRKTSKKGANKVAFSGRIGKKKLKPGKYRASLTAYNKTGKSKTVRKAFTIVKR